MGVDERLGALLLERSREAVDVDAGVSKLRQ
jgi:hypothetical protein